jgi:hypothetical protein
VSAEITRHSAWTANYLRQGLTWGDLSAEQRAFVASIERAHAARRASPVPAAEARRDMRPKIVMRPGQLPEVVTEAEGALLAAGVPIYQRGGELVHPVRIDKDEEAAVRRPAGSSVLHSVGEPWLVEQMGRAAAWFNLRPQGGKLRRVAADPKGVYARTLQGRVGEWRFPVLRTVTTAPTLDADGRIIEAPGYDGRSQLFLDLVAGAFPPVAERPTKDDGARSLALLDRLLRGFPFETKAARSVALSCVLTAAIRAALRAAPLFANDAPAARTGKSLLAETVGIVVTGRKPPAMSQGKNPEEDEKRLSTVLHYGDPVLHIDNCERPLGGEFLCSMLTQEVVQARILGQSERRVMPVTTTVIASGNNLTFVGDVCSRVVPCRLDARVERPDEREFDFDVHAEAAANRPELLVAALTALRAYHVAGRPGKLKPMGGFEDWGWIRGTLVWLGYEDPAETREVVIGTDPQREGLVQVMDLWARAFGASIVTVAEIQRRAGPAFTDLQAKLEEVACRGEYDAARVGRWLRGNRDRVVGQRRFAEAGQTRDKVQTWQLSGAGAVQGDLPLGGEL